MSSQRMLRGSVKQPTLKFFVSTAMSCGLWQITEAFLQVRKLLSAVAHHLAEYLLTEKLFMFMTSRPSSKRNTQIRERLSSALAIGQFSAHRYCERVSLWA